MLGHEVACLDARNMEALGWDGRPFREFRRRGGVCIVRPETRLRRINDYIHATRESGGAEHWWDNWCEGMALSPGFGGDAAKVSAAHVDCVKIGGGLR